MLLNMTPNTIKYSECLCWQQCASMTDDVVPPQPHSQPTLNTIRNQNPQRVKITF